jgi:ubiquinone/menaquinone biosynthesis C-methylase UbiE
MKYDKDAEEARKIYNIYGDYFVKMEDRKKERKHLSEIILSMLGNIKGKKILDAGCGAGRECKVLAKKGAKVIGIDVSDRMIALAKERCKKLNVKFFVGDMGKTKFKENYFDMIITIFATMYKKNLKKLFREFKRILKKNGVLLIVVSHPIRKMIKYTKNYFERGKHWEIHDGIKFFNYYWTMEDYINTLISQGFIITEMREPKLKFENYKENFYPHYLILKAKVK